MRCHVDTQRDLVSALEVPDSYFTPLWSRHRLYRRHYGHWFNKTATIFNRSVERFSRSWVKCCRHGCGIFLPPNDKMTASRPLRYVRVGMQTLLSQTLKTRQNYSKHQICIIFVWEYRNTRHTISKFDISLLRHETNRKSVLSLNVVYFRGCSLSKPKKTASSLHGGDNCSVVRTSSQKFSNSNVVFWTRKTDSPKVQNCVRSVWECEIIPSPRPRSRSNSMNVEQDIVRMADCDWNRSWLVL